MATPKRFRIRPVLPELSVLHRKAKEAGELEVGVWKAILSHSRFAAASCRFRVAVLRDAARSFFRTYQARQRLPDLDQALACWRQALALTPSDSSQCKDLFWNIGVGLGERYTRTHNPDELREAIRAYQQAVKHIPPDSPDRAQCFNNLGTHLSELYTHTGEVGDLQAAIRACQMAVNLSPPGGPNRAARLSNLGSALHDLYGRTHNLAVLQKAVASFEQAVELTKARSAGLLNNLAGALSDRYLWLGDVVDMESAVRHSERALVLAQRGSSCLPKLLTTCGNALSDRYFHTGNLTDLKAAITYYQRAVDLTPGDSPDLGDYLHNLSAALRARYRHAGSLADSVEADRIDRDIEALATPPTATNVPGILTSRGNRLSDRYARSGSEEDLKKELDAYREALRHTPKGSPQRAEILNNLGTGLQERYERTGDLEDLHEAIRIYQQAVNGTPEGSPQRPGIVNSLGAGLLVRYDRIHKIADLLHAITIFRQAVDLSPETAIDRPLYLDALGSGLHTLYLRTGILVYLENALLVLRQALSSTPKGSPDRPARSNNLGTAFRARYHAPNGKPAQLQQALAAYKQAVSLTPRNAPARPLYLINLATALRDLYDASRDPAHRKHAIRAYQRACRRGLAVAFEQALTSSRRWGEWALDRRAWKEAGEAYDLGLMAIDALFRTQLRRVSKESWLRDAQGLHSYAAYARAWRGDLSGAVMALEQGSARMLAEALAFETTDLQALEKTRPDLVKRYRDVRQRLLDSRNAELRHVSAATTPEIDRMRADRHDLETLITEIRGIGGHEDFLVPPEFVHVKAAAAFAPLVYLAVTPVGGLALLVEADGKVTSIRGDDLTEAALRKALLGVEEKLDPNSYLGAYRRWRSKPQGKSASAAWSLALDRTTNWLWKVLMGKLVQVLTDRGISRVVLIPQGLLGLLPLHAAWIEDPDGSGRRYALDTTLFTYAPNAVALLACQARAATLPADTILALRDPGGSLRYSAQEIEAALNHFPLRNRRKLLSPGGPPVTMEALVAYFAQGMANVLHFSVHGQAGTKDPLDASLTIARGTKLTLRQILQVRLRYIRLAVLSACETGIPGIDLPDEIVSLPTGFVQAGVAGVIGSLWIVDDRSTTMLMRKFYELWRDKKKPFDPAEALREAQLWLRKMPGFDSPSDWAAFGYNGV